MRGKKNPDCPKCKKGVLKWCLPSKDVVNPDIWITYCDNPKCDFQGVGGDWQSIDDYEKEKLRDSKILNPPEEMESN